MAIESVGAGQFEVIPDDVQGFGRVAYRMAEELRSGCATLDGEVQGLMSTWKGAAADSYLAGWNEMRTGAVEVWDALFELAAKLGITAENLHDSDTAFGSGFSSLVLP